MKTTRTALALLLVVAVAGSGCAALVGGAVGAGAGVGGYKYAAGRFDTDYRRPYEQVYDATLASLHEMNMPVTKTEKNAAGAKVEANRADGTKVKIDLTKTGPQATEARIRVGLLGDENASRTIADRIAAKLGEEERQPEGRGGEAG